MEHDKQLRVHARVATGIGFRFEPATSDVDPQGLSTASIGGVPRWSRATRRRARQQRHQECSCKRRAHRQPILATTVHLL